MSDPAATTTGVPPAATGTPPAAKVPPAGAALTKKSPTGKLPMKKKSPVPGKTSPTPPAGGPKTKATPPADGAVADPPAAPADGSKTPPVDGAAAPTAPKLPVGAKKSPTGKTLPKKMPIPGAATTSPAPGADAKKSPTKSPVKKMMPTGKAPTKVPAGKAGVKVPPSTPGGAGGEKTPPVESKSPPPEPEATASANAPKAGTGDDTPPPNAGANALEPALHAGGGTPPPGEGGATAAPPEKKDDGRVDEATLAKEAEERKKREEEDKKKQEEAKKKEEEDKKKNVAAAPPARARKRPIVDTSSRKKMGPLTSDPRSGLPLLEIPRDRQKNFEHIGTDLVLHNFLDIDRITSNGTSKRITLFVTDQTLFICEAENGAVSRSVPVSSIMQVNVAQDGSNGLAFVVPSEYDIIVKPDRKQQRDDLLVVLRLVYKRLTNNELNVHSVKEIKANQYRMAKPPGFQLQMIPQRTRANLQAALEAIEQEELDRAEAINSVTMQLEGDFKQELETKQAELRSVQSRLDKATTRLREQNEELEALRNQYGKTKKRVEEIESQMQSSVGGSETLASKESKIHELQDVVDALTSAVSKANEERHRLEQLRRRGDFQEFDMDHADSENTRFRGRSLHQQGLVEVLQRQLADKRRELSLLATRTTEEGRLNLELARKEEVLRDYEQMVPSKSRESDPMLLYSDLPGTNVEDMLDRRERAAPPSRLFGGRGGGTVDPVLGLATTVGRNELIQDEDGDEGHGGLVPQHKVHLSNDLPEYKLPDDDRDFTVDPRTQLKFIDIPPLFQESFKELMGTILHLFAVASKSNKRGREQKRVILVSDRVLYQCNTAGHINRCVPVVNIREMQIDNQFNVALIIDGRNEYDMSFRFDSMSICDEMANVIKRTTTFLRRVPPVKITHMDRIIQSDLRLEKPPAWEFRLHPLAPRKALFNALRELSQSTAEQRARIHEQADQQTLELINRLKEEMRPEITMRREREFSVLRQQLTILDNSLRERQAEARLLRRRIADHRCNVDTLKLSNRGALAQEATEAPGMYWIPSDPVIMECQLDILHIAFHDNFVVTSHANGVLNVWDLTTADLFRTLKTDSHTSRVQAFHFEAHILISGGYDGSLRQWSIVEGVCSKKVPGAHRGHITCLKFDHAYLVTGGSDAFVHVWDVGSLKQIKTLAGHKSGVTALSFQRQTLATAEWGWIFIWDIEKGLVNKVLRDDNGGIATIDIQGSTIVTGGTGGVLIVWNLHTNEGEQLEGHTDDVFCVQLQSQFAISSSADGTIRMWNAKDRTPLGVFHNCAPAECRTFHFKANRFVIAEGRTIKAWTR